MVMECCETFSDFGPPPDFLLSIPPPPIPPFMENFASKFSSEEFEFVGNDLIEDSTIHCDLCEWLKTQNKVGFVELTQKGPLIDDTWFLAIISTCVGVALIGIIVVIAVLKYREVRLKPLSDVVLAKKEKALGLERCETVLYPSNSMTTVDRRPSRALWAGLKPLDGNHYTVDHCQPMDQKSVNLITSTDDYDYADYSSFTYTTGGTPYESPIKSQVDSTSLSNSLLVTPALSPSQENFGFLSVTPMSKARRFGADSCAVSRAAYLLGTKTYRTPKGMSHIYEMVTPNSASSTPRRRKSVEQGGRLTPLISAPTYSPRIQLPPLNSRLDGHYTLTAHYNGTHSLSAYGPASYINRTLTRRGGLTPTLSRRSEPRTERKYAHVSLNRSGAPNTSLYRTTSTDNVYESPITSPVI